MPISLNPFAKKANHPAALPQLPPHEMVQNLVNGTYTTTSFNPARDLQLTALSNDQLLDAYAQTRHALADQSAKDRHVNLRLLLIELKDTMLRRSADNPFTDATDLCQQAEARGLKDLQRQLLKTQGASPFRSLGHLVPKNNNEQVDHSNKKIRVLHVTYEDSFARIGGIGTVVEALAPAQNEKGLIAKTVTPYYSFYANHAQFEQAEFVGFVEHDYLADKQQGDSHVKSSIYKIRKADGVTMYMVKPDPRHSKIFDIREERTLYETTKEGNFWDRNFYFASATAAMAALYQGKTGDKSIDIAHIHWTHTALASRLLVEKYNPQREAKGLSPVRSVHHFHFSSFSSRGYTDEKGYARIGLQPLRKQYKNIAGGKKSKGMDMQRDGWLAANAVVHVSDHYKKIATKSYTTMHEISRTLEKEGNLKAVLNGIAHRKYDVANRGVYKDYAIDPESVATATPFQAGKQRAKSALFRAGVVADESKPLFMYVGRYSPEKGVETLPAMVEEIIRQGGQAVIMGTLRDNRTPGYIKKLLKMQKKYPNQLKVYTKLEEQTTLLGDTGVTKGAMIRLATDFGLVPSLKESCGLVGMEALSTGAKVVSSKVQGLGDFLKSHPEEGYNAFSYDAGHQPEFAPRKLRVLKLLTTLVSILKRPRNSKKAIRRAMKHYNNSTVESREADTRRIWEDSKKFDWKAEGGAADKFTKVYEDLIENGTKTVLETEAYTVKKKRGILRALCGRIGRAARSIF